MPRVVPSQVVAFIASIPNYVVPVNLASMNHVGSPNLSCILDLVQRIPDELLTMNGTTYASFVQAQAHIRDVLEVWVANRTANVTLVQRSFSIEQDPVATIRRALATCPDQAPAPTTSELKFITDADLRDNLRKDIGEVARALADGEFKGATVLAGAAIEALLLWELQNRSGTKVQSALSKLAAADPHFKNLSTNLERWDLHDYIEVSAEIGVIKPDTVTEARLAKGFRNLIHPGRAQRLGQTCDRGTAHAAYAALDHVIRDLS